MIWVLVWVPAPVCCVSHHSPGRKQWAHWRVNEEARMVKHPGAYNSRETLPSLGPAGQRRADHQSLDRPVAVTKTGPPGRSCCRQRNRHCHTLGGEPREKSISISFFSFHPLCSCHCFSLVQLNGKSEGKGPVGYTPQKPVSWGTELSGGWGGGNTQTTLQPYTGSLKHSFGAQFLILIKWGEL